MSVSLASSLTDHRKVSYPNALSVQQIKSPPEIRASVFLAVVVQLMIQILKIAYVRITLWSLKVKHKNLAQHVARKPSQDLRTV